jgi:hypothetical protein
LVIHLIPHSHDDLGWNLKIDEYFYKYSDRISCGNVSGIISEIVDSISFDSDKRFTWSEMKYLRMWFD